MIDKQVVIREKNWHNNRFKDGGDSRQKNVLLRHAYYATSFANRRFNNIQKIDNARVLDVGCGRGISRAKMFVNRGCNYVGLDISDECILANCRDAELAGINVDFICDDANTLNSLSQSQFDLIVMSGTLHHLDIKTSLDTFARLLDQNGSLLMWEPMASNPFINLYRAFTPHLRTDDEHPLKFSDLSYIKKIFPNTRIEFHVLSSLLSIPVFFITSIFRVSTLGRYMADFLGRIDMFLGKIPFLKRFHWIVIIDSRF